MTIFHFKTYFMSIEIVCLQNTLRSMGFGPDFILGEDLRSFTTRDLVGFDISTKMVMDDFTILEILLFFRRVGQSYCLERYRATLHDELDPSKSRSQTFYVADGLNLRLNEIYNLLQGRSVNKDLTPPQKEKYNAWLRLSFTNTDSEGNYKILKFRSWHGNNLRNVLNKYPICELAHADLKEAIIVSLKAGEIQPVTFYTPSGKKEKKMIEANPVYKTIHIYPVDKTAQNKMGR